MERALHTFATFAEQWLAVLTRVFITTGNFSRDAVKEATRDSALPIELVDGDQLTDKLKEFSLGTKTEMIENVTVDVDWFTKL